MSSRLSQDVAAAAPSASRSLRRLRVAEDAGERLIQLMRQRCAPARPGSIGAPCAPAPDGCAARRARPGGASGRWPGRRRPGATGPRRRRHRPLAGRRHGQRPAHRVAGDKRQHDQTDGGRGRGTSGDPRRRLDGIARGPTPLDRRRVAPGRSRRESVAECRASTADRRPFPTLSPTSSPAAVVDLQDDDAMQAQKTQRPALSACLERHRVVGAEGRPKCATAALRTAAARPARRWPAGDRRAARPCTSAASRWSRGSSARRAGCRRPAAARTAGCRRWPRTLAIAASSSSAALTPPTPKRIAAQPNSGNSQHDRRRGHDRQVVAHGRRAEHHHADAVSATASAMASIDPQRARPAGAGSSSARPAEEDRRHDAELGQDVGEHAGAEDVPVGLAAQLVDDRGVGERREDRREPGRRRR